VFSVPFLIVTILWGNGILHLLFGGDFGDGVLPMAVRLMGFVILFSLGPVMAVLQVSRHCAYLARSMAIGIPIQILFTYLGPLVWGSTGTAFGWVLGMIITRAIAVYFCIHKIRVNPMLRISTRSIHDTWRIALDVIGFACKK
jgi:O-antigen/teichoic acid export membrane protein